MITNKIDFALVFSVNRANPNGDPLNGNRPRTDYDGYGEVSDVCIKRKIRNRLQDMQQNIFVKSDDRCNDGYKTLKDRAEGLKSLKTITKSEDFIKIVCNEWIDVRAFGQVFAYKKLSEFNDVSIGIRGPVSIHTARSVEPVDIVDMQITKSVNNEKSSKGDDRSSSDRMGLKHHIDFGVYVTYGSMNVQLSEKTGFNDDDAELIRQAMISLFENDTSSARPDGCMIVEKVVWWKHNCQTGQYSSAKVHKTLIVKQNNREIEIYTEDLPGLTPQLFDGI